MSDLRQVRIEKLERLKELGQPPYADRWACTHTTAQAVEAADGEKVSLAGRLLTIRKFGKLNFAHVLDRAGKVQVSFEKKTLSEEQFELFKSVCDIADFVGIEGELWTTQKGERTVRVLSFRVLSKALLPLPEKHHGLVDQDARYRQRYLDLISNDDTRARFRTRSKVVSFIRSFLDKADFLEVETPILQTASSGAAARPFITHHNALDRDLFLRISPETYLKRLVVGGLERVYEIGRCFRNEGIDPSHAQEFTMLEWYAAYWDFRDNIRFIQDLIRGILMETVGTLQIDYQGTTLDFEGDWPEVSFREAVLERCGVDLARHTTYEELAAAVKAAGVELDLEKYPSWPALADGIYKKVVRPHLIQPTLLVFHPTELVPLARRNDDDPSVLDMFQVVVNTWEIVKAYSELVDPVDQKARMEEQQEFRAAGDDETMMMEEDYIECMEHGMPPISGLGLGIDRFVALITNAETLRDVILFPSLREG